MNNIERLQEYINRVEVLVANTEKRIATGELWLDAQLGSLIRHLSSLREQLLDATKSKQSDGGEYFERHPIGMVAVRVSGRHDLAKWKKSIVTERSEALTKAPRVFYREGSEERRNILTDVTRLANDVKLSQFDTGVLLQKSTEHQKQKSKTTLLKYNNTDRIRSGWSFRDKNR